MKKIKVLAFLILLVMIFHQCLNTGRPVHKRLYTGSDKCQSCHPKEFELYKTSDHFHAMDSALPANVKADFNNARFIYNNDTTFFYTKEGRYYVRTTDTTGIKKEFEISYTFGWKPLQQYLVQFADGRIQVLPFCWDTREKEKGGQRWFHLYGKEKITPDDELFWMGYNQNWNYMCADCHTTNYKKNFNLSQNSFHSTWSEQRVSCESCHGPASEHLEWTKNRDASVTYMGFNMSISQKSIQWEMNAVKQTQLPVTVIKNDTLIETCARCHARAVRFSDEYVHGNSLLQTHLPSTTGPASYFIDGQIKEEDYEYGSFLQSKMYAAGVTCINCHDAHSMKIKATGNSLCGNCHSPAKYDGSQHSFHKVDGKGNQCVSCHMPVTTYMLVDDRLDHSIRIPRPDQSLTMGTPNACNKCHSDKTVQWAAKNFNKWFGEKTKDIQNYASLLHNISQYINESEPSLFQLLSSKNYPAIIKATAMEQYGYYTSAKVSKLIFEELKNSNPLLRLSALKALSAYPTEKAIPYVTPLLYDSVVSVRMEAMSLLAPGFAKLMGDESNRFYAVMNEYMNVQEQMSHRPEGFFNRAIIKAYIGDFESATQLYISCLQRFPNFVQAYINLIDLYRQQDKEGEAKKMIEAGLKKHSGNPFLHYASGLWYIRKKDNVNGLAELKKAAFSGPQDPQITYAYAVGLYSTGEAAKAIQVLEKFGAKYGNQPSILDGLISICMDAKQTGKANKYLETRKDIFGY
ncbi:MAG: multiheme c-type cytochrome [Ferruginibacter sp.]